MGRRDSQGNGLVPRQAFTIQMREVLPDNLNEINLLANTYSQPYSGMIEYRKMNDDLLRLDDSSTSSSNSLIRQFIWNYKVSIKQTLKGVFDMHSAKTIMSFKDLNDLLVKGGFSSPNREFVEGFMKTYSHQHGGVLTFFDFLSAFDAKTIETEIALILRRHEIIWLDVKKTVQATFNTTISQKFSACNMVSTLVQELEKMPAMADKKIALLDLVRVFADPVLGNDKLDRHALKLAEDTVTQASFQMFAPQLKPDTSTLIVPGSTITFKKLKSLQKYVQSLDDDCQSLLKTPLLQVFKKRDPKNVGKLPLDGFLKLLREDVGDEVDEKKDTKFVALLENILGYCGDNLKNLDYVKLCLLAKDDVAKVEEKLKFEHEQVLATQSAIQAQSESKANLIQEGLKESQLPTSPMPTIGPFPLPLPDTASMSIKQQIVAHYSRIPFTKEEILKRLIPNDEFAHLSSIEKVIKEDIKDINQPNLIAFLKGIAGEKADVTKAQMKDALFQETQIKKAAHDITIDDHVDMVFAELDLEQKNALSKYQVSLGCKYLGLNLSEGEIENLFNKYKHRDSAFMDVKGFSRLIKFEYFKDISKDRLVHDKFQEYCKLIDPRETRRINVAQLRALYSKLGSIPTESEINSIMINCDPLKSDQKDGDTTISLDKLSNLVTHLSPVFNTDNDELINALVKIRSNLSFNVADQFHGFKYMPRNYVSSFSEDLYMNGNQNIPTSGLRPVLSDTKSYYVNLSSPSTNTEIPGQSKVKSFYKIPKFLRPSRYTSIYEITLDKATGVPIPDDSLVRTSEIVGREVRICMFEENQNKFVSNCLNLECQWKMEYEDRFYFEPHDIPKENTIYVKLPEMEVNARDKKYMVVFELVNFIRKEKASATLAMTAGYAKFALADFQLERSLNLDITGGSPTREKTVNINPDDIRHKRRGFFPKLASIFEGKIKSQLAVKIKPLKINPAKITEHEEELELLPDMGVFQYNQVKIMSCFRQCLGRDAFSVSGTVASSINKNLTSEVYVSAFCNIFCMPMCAVALSHFWSSNVNVVYGKDRYDLRMDILKKLFSLIYPTLNSLNFRFQRHYPTDQLYGQFKEMEERKRLLKGVLEDSWMRISEEYPVKKAAPPRFLPDLAKITQSEIATQHSTFNIQELMDEDFDIQF